MTTCALREGIRQEQARLTAAELSELAALTDSWADMLRLHDIDPSDPVVGETILVMAKAMTHRMDCAAELQRLPEGAMLGSRWVTMEAAHVGANLFAVAGSAVTGWSRERNTGEA